MQFIREKLTGSFQSQAGGNLLQALDDAFKPVIFGATEELFKEKSQFLPQGVCGRKLIGDLFVTESKDVFFYRFSPKFDSLVAGAVCNSERGNSDWRRFRDGLSGFLGRRDWKNDIDVSDKFKMLAEETQPLVVSDWERQAAVALQQPSLRELINVISKTDSCTLQEAAGDRPVEEVKEDVQMLVDLGVITSEFEVYCRQTRQKVSCVASLEALDEASKRGFKCFHCGHAINEERVVQVLSITNNGRRFTSKNMWMAFLVGAALTDEGVDPQNISYRSENQGEIVEIFADVRGALFMLSVSEDEITPGAAFRFLTRTRFFDPDWGFLVTPVEVGTDARLVVSNGSDRFAVVEGLASLGEAVRLGVTRAAQKEVMDLLCKFDGLTSIDVGRWASEYMMGPDEVIGGDSEPEASPIVQAESEEVDIDDEEEVQEKEEPQVEPARAAIAISDITGKILERLPQAVESTDTDEVNVLVCSVSGLPGCSAMVAGADGMSFLGCLDTVDDSDTVAALQLDLMQSVTKALSAYDKGALRSVMLCSDSETLHVHASVDGYNLITHQRSAEIDAIKKVDDSHKKSVMRLKKALQGLVSLPGVAGSVAFDNNGEVLQAVGLDNALDLAGYFAQLVKESFAPFCTDTSLNPQHAFLVQTENNSYHLLCLPDEKYLLSVLHTTTPAYVWRNDISFEAGYVAANV